MHSRSRIRLLGYFPAILLCFAAADSRAQEPSWPIEGPAFTATAADIQKAASNVPAEKFAEATVLLERDAYSVDAAGRMSYRHTMIFRMESQAGVDDWSEIRMHWEPWYQNQPEIRARVIAVDGKVSTLDPKTVTDGPAREDSEDTYTDARIRKAPLPGAAVGAIVEEETTLADKTPFFVGGGVYRDSFSRDVPIIRAELAVDVPKELNFRYRVHTLPSAKITDEQNAGVRHVTFTSGYLKPHADSDINLTTREDSGPLIEFSTGESWGSVAAAYRQLAEAQIDPGKVKPLLPSPASGDRMAEIAAIVARLHKEVRYTGIEFGQASLQPAPAAEITKRHFGDCKDKAALLVAMLRSAGIAANLALLNAGPGLDVNPDLPGMNEFDHAIVFVPGKDGGSDLWIDATDEFAQVGGLPAMDEGRLALIIGEGTATLTPTPTPKADADTLVELRDVVMAEYGASHIVETSVTRGPVDAEYRSEYGGQETREKKEGLEKYAKNGYLAKALASVQHGDAHDLTRPFDLKLDMKEAKRGNTLIDDAAVGIPFADIFYRLPEWFRTDPKVEGEKLTPQQEEDRKRAVEARNGEYEMHPFVTEWRYSITPPVGFELRALPENKTTAMGPAQFTQHYERDNQGVIKATFRFEAGKPRLTLDEALALREAVLAAYKQDIIVVMFDQAGAKLVASGKIREGLAADRQLIERHPTEGLHHAQIAYALLKAGMGDRARTEAQQATRLEPKSAVGYKALGWVCQFNQIAIQFGSGFDWDCAAAAYKKAIELDPDDTDTAINQAFLNEYDRDGERYTQQAHLAEAVLGFRAVKERDKAEGEGYEDNILFDLLYGGKFKEVLQELEKLPSSSSRRGMAIAATVAMEGGAKGIAAGIDRADHLAGGAQARSSALASAGTQLLHLRMYAEATGILSAGSEGQEDSSAVAQQIAVFRQVTPWKRDFLPASDPRGAVQRMFMAVVTGTFTEATADETLERHAYGSDEEWNRNLKKVTESRGLLHFMAGRSGLPAQVLLDVMAENLKLSAEGDDDRGYRITLQSLGTKPQQFFVSKENAAYKIVTDGGTPSEAGNEVLYLLHAGREKEARSLLDWVRDRLHKGGGDDALSGPLLPRFWSVGDSGDATAMHLAAAALLGVNPAIQGMIPQLRAAMDAASSDEARTSLSLLLANAFLSAEDGASLKAIAAEILGKYPDSYVAINLEANADDILKDWNDWKDLLESRLAKHPDDENLLRLKVQYAQAKGDFDLARATVQLLIDKGKASAGDYNNVGWMGLFDGKLEGDSVKAAQQANMLSKNTSFAELHTLACVYAAQGKAKEARDSLLKAMAAANLSAPNSEAWFGFGLIYEQYGVTDAAVEAYRKVEKPEGRVGPTSTYILAQKRLVSLNATH